MAALNLSQPPPFLQSVGPPLIPLKAWLQSFENYLVAMSESDLPDARKHALLIHCLGAEGQRLFYTLTVADDKYDTALKAIEDFFIPQVNVVAERYRFKQRSQRPGETTDQFAAALKELVTTCQFWAGDDTGSNRGEDKFNTHQRAFTTGGTAYTHQSFDDGTTD